VARAVWKRPSGATLEPVDATTAVFTGSSAAFLAAVLVAFLRLRARRRRMLFAPPGRNGRGGPAGVREPRRPLVPSSAGAAAAPIPPD